MHDDTTCKFIDAKTDTLVCIGIITSEDSSFFSLPQANIVGLEDFCSHVESFFHAAIQRMFPNRGDLPQTAESKVLMETGNKYICICNSVHNRVI